MPTSVVMPQMGESIAEGTIVRWIKKVGDTVDRDEPLFEISTDKVDAEIPVAGGRRAAEIRVNEGETVPVNSVVGVIGAEGEQARPTPRPKRRGRAPPPPPVDAAGATTAEPSPAAAPARQPRLGAAAVGTDERGLTRTTSAPEVVAARAADRAASTTSTSRDSPAPASAAASPSTTSSSSSTSGVGRAPSRGSRARRRPPARAARSSRGEPRRDPAAVGDAQEDRRAHGAQPAHVGARALGVRGGLHRRRGSPRGTKKAEYERAGAKLTYMAFIAKAVRRRAARATRSLNASLDGDNVVYKKDINLGIAVALDWGLIVPVIKNADEKNLLGLSRAIADLAERARAKQLKPEEVHGGTFTITNPGQFGALFGMPIINQPQVAILGVGTIEKRAVVVDDAIAIRTMAYLTLGYDHRLIDGAVADAVHGRRQAPPRDSSIRLGIHGRERHSVAHERPRSPAARRRALRRRRWRCSARSSRSAARAAIRDLLLLLQHPPVITLGVKGDGGRSNILADRRAAGRAGHRGVTRPAAAATSPTTGPARSSAIRSSTCGPIAATCTATSATSRK